MFHCRSLLGLFAADRENFSEDTHDCIRKCREKIVSY